MPTRPEELIATLQLEPHPEGGHYREVFRSSATVQPDDGRGARNALTAILFLLREDERSRWHRVASDEVWHFSEGDPLELRWIEPEERRLHHCRLGLVGPESQPVAAVPAGSWQAARPLGGYSLVSCTVGPGFDFADFDLLADDSDAIRWIHDLDPEGASFC